MSVFQTPRVRSLIIAALFGVAVLLAGCGALRIAYSQAPELSYWWLDGYVDFDSLQTPKVRAGLNEFFAWQRRTQLPDYAAQLARAQIEVLADTTPARVCEWQEQGIKRAKIAFDHIAPAAADVMLTITSEQLAHIEHRNAKYNDEYRSDYLQPDPAERAAETLKRTIDRAETLYGRLDEAQRAHIAAALKRSPFDPQIWLDERRQRQLDALQLLRQLNTPGTTQAQALLGLRFYAEHIEHSPREAYRAYADRLMSFNCAFAAELHNLTTVAQRHAAADKLAGWEGNLRALMTMPAANNVVEPRR